MAIFSLGSFHQTKMLRQEQTTTWRLLFSLSFWLSGSRFTVKNGIYIDELQVLQWLWGESESLVSGIWQIIWWCFRKIHLLLGCDISKFPPRNKLWNQWFKIITEQMFVVILSRKSNTPGMGEILWCFKSSMFPVNVSQMLVHNTSFVKPISTKITIL